MCTYMQIRPFYTLILSQLTRLSAEQTISEVAEEKLWPSVPFLQGFLPQQEVKTTGTGQAFTTTSAGQTGMEGGLQRAHLYC